MVLINRISRLFQADMHAVLDALEEPLAVLNQAIREMEAGLVQQRQQIKSCESEYGQLVSRQTQLEQGLNKINSELDLCMQSNEEDLARTVVKRKLHIQKTLRHLQENLLEREKRLEELRSQLKENEIRFTAMQQKAEVFSAENSPSVSLRESGVNDEYVVTEDEIEVALLKEKKRYQQQLEERGNV